MFFITYMDFYLNYIVKKKHAIGFKYNTFADRTGHHTIAKNDFGFCVRVRGI